MFQRFRYRIRVEFMNGELLRQKKGARTIQSFRTWVRGCVNLPKCEFLCIMYYFAMLYLYFEGLHNTVKGCTIQDARSHCALRKIVRVLRRDAAVLLSAAQCMSWLTQTHPMKPAGDTLQHHIGEGVTSLRQEEVQEDLGIPRMAMIRTTASVHVRSYPPSIKIQ